MSTKSNLYAEKIFAEHPIGLWSLDDNADYLSLISEAQRDLSSLWMYSDSTITNDVSDLNQPFPNSVKNLIEFDNFVGAEKELKFIGQDLISLNQLNFDLATLTTGCYFYTDSAFLRSISIGFEYTDVASGENVEKITEYFFNISQKWAFVSHTSTFPNQNTSFRPIIKIKFEGNAPSTDNYQIFINGLTVGQCSENFNTMSLGKTASSFPSNIELSGIDGAINLNSYVSGIKNGYYLIDNNRLTAKNTSIPMVYGSDSITKITANSDSSKPSLIIPGFGFLNETGKYREYTAEMWIKVNHGENIGALRIFGPIASNDGLYVEDGFITLVIGKHFASHYIGEWDRPMLIQIKLSPNNASLLINGEQVISLNIDISTISLPSEFGESSKEQDWLGFYAHDNHQYEIDCIAIYSYLVSDLVAKKRWVYGQAVVSPETVNSGYGASSAYIDYPFAEYAANYTYPDMGKWAQGTRDNLSVTQKTMSFPKYDLPTFFLDDYTNEKFTNDNSLIQNDDFEYFTFRPNEDWNNKKTYAYFDNFSTIKEDIQGIVSVIKFDAALDDVQTIFQIYNIDNGDYFKATLESDVIKYYFSYNQNITTLSESVSVLEDTYVPVGFNLTSMVDYFGSNLSTFFGNKSKLKIYLGANSGGLENFKGKFFKFHIFSNYNISLIPDLFELNGFAKTNKGNDFRAHTSTYSLIPQLKYQKFYLDTASAGYWEDYIPLSYFGSYVNNNRGEKIYSLDLLQFNLDYPAPTSLSSTEQESAWDYQGLDLAYDHTVQRSYNQLDNALFTGWEDYEDVGQKSIKTYYYNTSNSMIRSYVSFQYIELGANKNLNDFDTENIVSLRNDKILNISNFSNWQNKIFEVADNTIIYPPVGVDFNLLAIVVHLDFKIQGTQNKNIKLKKLEIASQAFDHNSAKKIGTRFGVPIYPYKKTGIYYDYQAKNPISIFKESAPYLYLTKKSGVEVRGSFSPFINRGVGVPINKSLSNNYKISALQMWLRYSFDKFPYGSVQVFEVQHKNDTIQFFVSAISQQGDRGKLFAINKSNGQNVNGLAFYINGTLVKDPVLEAKEWCVVGVSFANSINMDNFLGYINLNGPFVFNNISNYQSTALQDIQSKVYRPWLRVKNNGSFDLEWTYWDTSYDWNGVLILSSSELYGVDPSILYENYTGRNKIVIDSNTVDNLIFTADSVKIYSDTSWQTQVVNPV